MNILRKINDAFNKLEGALLIVLLSIMVVLAFWQVMMRNLFHGGFVWGDIVLRHIVLWLGFLGGALATSHQRHIHIDALAHYLPPRIKSILGIFTNLFGAVVCLLLLQASLTFIQGEKDAQSMIFEEIPAWYTQIIIPIGFGLHVIHFVLLSGMSAFEAFRKGEVA
jgi:TRAP-type C4-dicarboxylate transport system permease small subunit